MHDQNQLLNTIKNNNQAETLKIIPTISPEYFTQLAENSHTLQLFESSVHLAYARGFNRTVAAILNMNSNLLNKSIVNGFTLLHISVNFQHHQITEFLLSKGINVNTKNSNGVCALSLAVNLNDYMTVTKLIDYGSEIDTRDNKQKTALYYRGNF